MTRVFGSRTAYNPNIWREAYRYVTEVMTERNISPSEFDIYDMEEDQMDHFLGILMKHPETFEMDGLETIGEHDDSYDLVHYISKALINPYYNDELVVEIKKLYRSYYLKKMNELVVGYMAEYILENYPKGSFAESYPASEFWGMNLGF